MSHPEIERLHEAQASYKAEQVRGYLQHQAEKEGERHLQEHYRQEANRPSYRSSYDPPPDNTCCYIVLGILLLGAIRGGLENQSRELQIEVKNGWFSSPAGKWYPHPCRTWPACTMQLTRINSTHFSNDYFNVPGKQILVVNYHDVKY